jgi:chromate transporter
MHRVLVEERRWVDEARFLHALNFCMLLPGPEAMQLATYIGWLLHGYAGGLAAGLLFILPGFFTILALSAIYAQWGDVALISALFYGLKAAVLAVVVEAVFRIGRRVLKNTVMTGIAAAAFVAIFFFNVPFPIIVLSAGLLGWIGSWRWPDWFVVIQPADVADNQAAGGKAARAAQAATGASLARALRVTGLWLALWFVPIAWLALAYGPDNVYVQEGLFFSKAAVVTFGGAYAVLAYIAQQAVEVYGWLLPGEMLDGLGLAETTPGPLILVVEFVGYLGAYRDPGALTPWLAGTLGALLTVWVTFVPCFLWIFLGAPYIERLHGQRSLSAALSSITASVVGVVLNLALWFALHVLFGSIEERNYAAGLRLFIPDPATLDLFALTIMLGALVALLRYRAGMLPTLFGAALIGMLYRSLI